MQSSILNRPSSPRAANEVVSRAVAHQLKGDFSTAEKVCLQALSDNPDDVQVLHLMGILAHQRGKSASAIEWFEKALSKDQSIPDLHNNFGAVLFGLAEYRKAREQYLRALELRPTYAEAHFNVGQCDERLGDLMAAAASYERAAQLNSQLAPAYNSRGLLFQKEDRLEEALACYRRAVSVLPDYSEAHLNVGNVMRLLGRNAEAIAEYKEAIRIRSNFPEAHNNLGVSLAAEGDVLTAEQCYRRALSFNPEYAEALCNLGNLLRLRRRPDEALACYEQAIAIRRDFAPAQIEICALLREQGKFDDAIMAGEKAIALAPFSAEAHNNLGAAHLKKGALNPEHLNIALDCFRKSTELKPKFADAHNNIGAAFQAMGNLQQAFSSYQHAATLEPKFAYARNNLGVMLQVFGRIEEAITEIRTAIELDPDNVLFYYNLTQTKRAEVGDPEIAALERLERSDCLSDEGLMFLHFSLGKIYGELSEHRRSFLHFLEANRLKRRQISYKEQVETTAIDGMKERFTRQRFERNRGLGVHSELPIFIVGMPRSGTTLVEQILASHPAVFGAGELKDLRSTLKGMRDRIAQEKATGVNVTGRMKLEWLAQTYLERVRARAPEGIERITDKMPSNSLFLGYIHLALPRAKIIHVRRNPLDNCVSCFSQLFSEGQDFSYDLSELGRYYRAHDDLMRHWRAELPSGSMLEVQYEELVGDIESQSRRILEYCGLTWDPKCLEFYKAERPVMTASSIQVRRPVYRSSVGRWRAYRDLLQPLMDALGDLVPADINAAELGKS